MIHTRLKAFLLILLCAACSQAITDVPITTGAPILPTATLTLPPQVTNTPSQVANNTPTTVPEILGSLEVITAANTGQIKRLFVLRGPTDRITDLAFSGDGAYLASTGYDEKVRLWDLGTRQEVYSFPLREADLNAIAFSPDGSLLASGQAIWNVATRQTVHIVDEQLFEPSHVAFSPDGSRFVAVANHTINVWDVAGWKEALSIDFPAECLWLFGISFSPDGKWLAAGSGANGTVYFWSAETGEMAFALEQGNQHDVHDIAFSPDGKFLATGGSDYFARLWNVVDRTEVRKMPLIGMYSLAISPDGALLATAGPDRAVKLWDVQNGRMLKSLPHADELMAVAFSADGRLMAAGGYDDTIVVWGISQSATTPAP